MLKKMAMLLGILMLVIPVSVNAATFKDGDTQYSLEEVKFEYEELEGAELIGLDKDNNYVFRKYINEDDKFYKVNKDKCVGMTPQEVLDFYRTRIDHTICEMDGYDLYLVEANEMLIKATTFDASQTYYYHFDSIVTNPTEEDLDNYYIRVYTKTPIIAEIDESAIYYDPGMIGFGTKVENPVVEDMYSYQVIIEEPTRTKVMTLDSNVWEEIFNNYSTYWEWGWYYSEENKIVIYSHPAKGMDYGYIAYDIEGNIYEGSESEDNEEQGYYGGLADSLYIKFGDEKTEILDSNKKHLYEIDGYLNELEYANYVSLLRRIIYADNLGTVDVYNNYNLYVYKLLSKDNQEYADKDIIVEISGQKDRIKAITVNGKALDEDNYTLSGTLTTVGLKKAYLETLAKGEYTLEVEYTDGVKVASTFVKKASPVVDDDKETEDKNPEIEDKPATEDKKPVLDNTPTTGVVDTSIIALFVVATGALFSLAGTALKAKKEK